ncbi:MAG: hypothetical protein HFE83_13315 [Lachnospiraceae bacterium]|nr:hypothetical protein [Lachnospiraceae bacterium]
MKQEAIKVRRACLGDIDSIIEFIKNHYYIPNHVFTRRRDIFNDWHVQGENVYFAIAEGTESKMIYGILGYTLYSKALTPDVSLAIFQTIKSSDPALGIRLVLFVKSLYPDSLICSSGIVPNTRGLYEFLGYKTGKLKHYYRLNDLEEYKIAKIQKKEILPVKEEGYCMKHFHTIQAVRTAVNTEIFKTTRPYKDCAYIQEKYYDNIGYSYMVYGIFNHLKQCVGLLAGREILYGNRKCFKIVDYIGKDEELGHCSKAFSDFIICADYEYMDFYQIGIDDTMMQRAGFLLNDGTENIIPQFFEPYVAKNIDIFYFTTNTELFHGYRCDGGQERPNFIGIDCEDYKHG